LLITVAKMSPAHMIIVLNTRFVTAKHEQIPKIWRKMGFSFQMFSENTLAFSALKICISNSFKGLE